MRDGGPGSVGPRGSACGGRPATLLYRSAAWFAKGLREYTKSGRRGYRAGGCGQWGLPARGRGRPAVTWSTSHPRAQLARPRPLLLHYLLDSSGDGGTAGAQRAGRGGGGGRSPTPRCSCRTPRASEGRGWRWGRGFSAPGPHPLTSGSPGVSELPRRYLGALLGVPQEQSPRGCFRRQSGLVLNC